MRQILFGSKHYCAYIFENEEEMADFAAGIVIDRLKRKPDLRLGLATGSTPVPLYRALVRAYQRGEISFSRVNTYNLDEYYPIDPKNPQSFLAFMRANLFDHIDLPEENIHIPCGSAPDADEEARRYQSVLNRAGGTDIQVLGVGSDGHIGFNEPGPAFLYDTHATDLTPETIRDNSRFFSSVSEVPTRAITMGIGSIMTSQTCLFLATGKNKAAAVRHAFLEDPAPACQASVLQFHRDVIILLDEAAASEL